MITHFDHVTLCVRDVDAAKRFFALLGFEEHDRAVMAGERFAAYMGVADIDAEQVVLTVPGMLPRFEIHLLCYRRPITAVAADAAVARLDQPGFNHICFAVADAEATVARLRAHGVAVRGRLERFRDRRLFLVTGPEGISVELAQWD